MIPALWHLGKCRALVAIKRSAVRAEEGVNRLTVEDFLLLFSCSAMSDSLQPRGLSCTRPLCPWAFPSKNTGVGYPFLLQGIFLTQAWNPCLLRWQADSLPLSRFLGQWTALNNTMLVDTCDSTFVQTKRKLWHRLWTLMMTCHCGFILGKVCTILVRDAGNEGGYACVQGRGHWGNLCTFPSILL